MSAAARDWHPVVLGPDDPAPGFPNLDDPAEDEPAAATAAATPRNPTGGAQRVGVHRGADAEAPSGDQADAPSRGRAGARARKIAGHLAASAAAEASAALTHNANSGPPHKVQPPSLEQLRRSIHVRAAAHDLLPPVKAGYLAWGYLWELPVTAAGYAGLWIAQAPARIFLVMVVWVILHATGLAPQLPFVGHIPGVRDLI